MTDIEHIVKAARAGGEVIRNYFGASLNIAQKSSVSDYQTQADLESEAAILASLERDFPTHSIFSEERGSIDKKSDFLFVIDPLDGTNNFVLGLPTFCVSIGLFYKREAIAAVIYQPMLGHVYVAEKGQGAHCDGKKLSVSGEKDIARATLASTCSYLTPQRNFMDMNNRLLSLDPKRLLTTWAPTVDFCLLAAGRIESFAVLDCAWYDFAAGKLIAKEAGAMVTDWNGRPETEDANNRFVVSNREEIHAKVIRALEM